MTTSVRAEILLSLKDSLSGPAAKAGQSVKGLSGDIKQGFGSAIQTLTGFNVASLGVAGAIGGLAAGIKYAVDQAAEAERIFSITEAVVKSTGGAAGLTAEQISNMAGRLSQLNAVDDEVILSAQNVLLTFKKIKGEAFEQASQAALDLSVVMGGDLRSSMLMIGKALEDPIRGITALRRAGVSFTEDQRALIKELVNTGRQAEAMNIILTEVNTQVGGAGAAAADTYIGKMSALKIAVDNAAQALGENLLPALTAVAEQATTWLTVNNNLDQAVKDGIVTEQDRRDVLEAVRRGFITSAEAQDYLNEKTEQAAIAARNAADNTQDYAFRIERTIAPTNDLVTATSDMAIAYTRMGEAATNVEPAMEAINLGLEKQAAIMRDSLDAGLDGSIQNAIDNYAEVVARTQPEIDKLTADIVRMNAAQGKTFTVTTEAKHSVEQYRLAQIEAAEAATKLAETSMDNEEAWLRAKIAADGAAQTVAQMGKEMGLTEQFTTDYTRQLMEANGELSQLEAEQLAAKEAIKQATAELLFQKVAADLDAQSALDLAREFGLLSEADYIAATAANTAAQARRDGKISVDQLYGSTVLLRDVINSLTDKNVSINVSTFYKEYYEQSGIRPEHEGDTGAGGAGAYGGGGPVETTPGDPRDNRAHGGPVIGGTTYLVGERGPELFTPSTSGHITPNDKMGWNITINVDARGASVDELSAQLAGKLRRALSNGGAYLGA